LKHREPVPESVMELPLHVRAFMALQDAVEQVIEEHLRDGLPIYVWRDGKVVDVSEELRIARASKLPAQGIDK
jgi:hypothetical protein